VNRLDSRDVSDESFDVFGVVAEVACFSFDVFFWVVLVGFC